MPVIRLEAWEVLDYLFEDELVFAVYSDVRQLFDYAVVDMKAVRLALSGRAPVVFERLHLLVDRPERKELHHGLKPRLVKI